MGSTKSTEERGNNATDWPTDWLTDWLVDCCLIDGHATCTRVDGNTGSISNAHEIQGTSLLLAS